MSPPEWSSIDAKRLLDFPARDTFIPALKVGTFTGATGLCAGGISSILLASKTPTLFTLASGIQCFLLGSTFWATRSTLLYTWTPPTKAHFPESERSNDAYYSPQDRVYASTISGGITGGTIGGLIRGRRNVLPATLIFTLFGYAGQSIYNRLDARHSEQIANTAAEGAGHSAVKQKHGFWQRVAEMKWSPMVSITDDEYAKLLKEKCLAVEAEIALVREEATRLREQREMIRERTIAADRDKEIDVRGDQNAQSERREP